jgi:hypothetical protein
MPRHSLYSGEYVPPIELHEFDPDVDPLVLFRGGFTLEHALMRIVNAIIENIMYLSMEG